MRQIDITTQGGRLIYIINKLGLSQTDFAKSIKTTKNYLSVYTRNHKALPLKFIDKIISRYPTINGAWLEYNIGTSGIEDMELTIREYIYIDKIAKLEAENNKLKSLLYEKYDNNIISTIF
jgi:Helix-turn-helix.